ncbi:MAG: HisA/HisF-related TIM barrel protein [Filomicrobium sp.]
MRIVPVMDLKNGHVVRAVRGDRKNYQPLETPLAPGSSEVTDVAAGLLNYFPQFRSLYVADLDGIEGRGADMDAIEALSQAHPDIEILLDNGAAGPAALSALERFQNVLPVVGAESLTSRTDLEEIREVRGGAFALSLDWRGATMLGPPDIYTEPALWPEIVIVMTLDRVGARQGPDFERVKWVKQMAGDREVFCAGGVRGLNDLQQAAQLGCSTLIATSIHDGTVSRAELSELISVR